MLKYVKMQSNLSVLLLIHDTINFFILVKSLYLWTFIYKPPLTVGVAFWVVAYEKFHCISLLTILEQHLFKLSRQMFGKYFLMLRDLCLFDSERNKIFQKAIISRLTLGLSSDLWVTFPLITNTHKTITFQSQTWGHVI